MNEKFKETRIMIADTRIKIITAYVIATEEEREELLKAWDKLNEQEEQLNALEVEYQILRGIG